MALPSENAERNENARAAALGASQGYTIHISRTAAARLRDAATARAAGARMSPIPVPTPRMRFQNEEQANRQFRLGEARGKSTAPATPDRRRIVASCSGIRSRSRSRIYDELSRSSLPSPQKGAGEKADPREESAPIYKASYKARRLPNPSVSSRPLLRPLARLSPGSVVT